jgi:hypothetical protein
MLKVNLIKCLWMSHSDRVENVRLSFKTTPSLYLFVYLFILNFAVGTRFALTGRLENLPSLLVHLQSAFKHKYLLEASVYVCLLNLSRLTVNSAPTLRLCT